MKIVIDAMGGDNAPNCVIDGTVAAINENSQIKIVLVGKQDVIENLLSKHNYNKDQIEIIDAQEEILNEDVPTVAIRHKKESSLVKALDYLKQTEDCVGLISCGSTGATLTGAFMKIGRMKGISRPALAPLLPAKKDRQVLLIDCGANVDAKPINLCHFAIMGSEYYKTMFNEPNPRVAILSNGAESGKGNDLVKKTYPLLEKLPINFVGNMEARYFMSGNYDVVVTDGFNGNVLLKSVEGSIKFAMDAVKEALTSSFKAKIGALLCKGGIKKIKNKLDYNKYGGSPFIGCKKTIIKSHGSSKAETVVAAIKQVVLLEQNKVNKKIEDALATLPPLELGEDND